jgi:hypothetical protein
MSLRNNIYYFLFLKYLVKNYQFQNYITKTWKDKNNNYYSFKIQLDS